jgi:hypothetical protein
VVVLGGVVVSGVVAGGMTGGVVPLPVVSPVVPVPVAPVVPLVPEVFAGVVVLSVAGGTTVVVSSRLQALSDAAARAATSRILGIGCNAFIVYSSFTVIRVAAQCGAGQSLARA